jgi:hypothetical protein
MAVRIHPLARSIARALLPLFVAWGCAAYLMAMLLWMIHGHRSRALAIAASLPAAAVVLWFSRWHATSWTRRSLALGLFRVFVVLSAMLVVVDAFAFGHKDPRSWAMWIPLQAAAFAPMMAHALPGIALGCGAGLALSYYWIVVRLRRAPFAVCLAWPAIWAFVAVNGFYRDSFVDTRRGPVESQPGVRVLIENPDRSCSIFAASCGARNFPRALAIVPASRRIFAGYGSTNADLHRDEPKLLSFVLSSPDLALAAETAGANQVRHFVPQAGTLAVSQWGRKTIFVYDAMSGVLVRTITPAPTPADYAAAATYVVGESVLLIQIWYPVVQFYSLRTGELERELDLFDRGLVSEGAQLDRGVLDLRRRRLWVPVAQFGTNLIEIDLDRLEPLRSIDLGLLAVGSLSLDEARGQLFAGSFIGPSVKVIDVENASVVDQLDGLWGARESVYDPERDNLYLVDYLHGTVGFYSLAQRKLFRRVRVGRKPAGAAVLGDQLYVNSSLGIVSVTL